MTSQGGSRLSSVHQIPPLRITQIRTTSIRTIRTIRTIAGRTEAATSASGLNADVAVVDSLIPWLKELGVSEPRVSIKNFGESGFGCIAKKPIKAGEDIFRLPENFTVSSIDVANHPIISSVAEGSDDLVGLSLWLMVERSSPSSPWTPFLGSFPESTLSPLLWEEGERERLLRGSPILADVKERVRILEQKFESLKNTHFDRFPEKFSPEIFNLQNFKKSFAVVLSRVIYLPSLDILALVPLADMVNHKSGCGAVTDFRGEDNMIVLVADRDYEEGEEVFCSYGVERSNADLLISYGFVPENNKSDFLELTVGLVPADRLFAMKRQLAAEAGFTEKQPFPLFPDRLPTQLLTYVRLSRLQDPALFAKVAFERDSMLTEANEYEVLMLLMGECREKLAAYTGSLEDDMQIVKQKNLSPEEKLAAKLRMGEKSILNAAMASLRNRLAPIRGVPSKGGQMQDPNSDIKELFEVMEKGLSAPRKFFSQIFDKK